MSQHTKIVEEQRQRLEQERIDESINFIEVRFAEGKWTTETIGYNSGKVVTKYNDKRKKEKVEYEI
jgi:hypothetical protein|tara:strand:+ start:574 stop:771 length:198 start_codon:yes stop_codon:yes gene_type:complete